MTLPLATIVTCGSARLTAAICGQAVGGSSCKSTGSQYGTNQRPDTKARFATCFSIGPHITNRGEGQSRNKPQTFLFYLGSVIVSMRQCYLVDVGDTSYLAPI